MSTKRRSSAANIAKSTRWWADRRVRNARSRWGHPGHFSPCASLARTLWIPGQEEVSFGGHRFTTLCLGHPRTPFAS